MVDTLLNQIKRLSLSQPDKIAVRFKNESLSYEQIVRVVSGIQNYLIESGIKKGDVISFSAVSKPEMVAAYLGIQACGGVAVFIDKHSTSKHMLDICTVSGSKMILTDKAIREHPKACKILSLRGLYNKVFRDDALPLDDVRIHENDLAEILFTSGTTGQPKGVMLSYKSVYNILMNTIKGIGYSSDSVVLLPLPLHHSFALRVLRAVLYSGGTVVLQNGFTFAKEAEKNIMGFGCNSMACVPASYEVMKKQMRDAFQQVMDNLKIIEFGAGSLSVRQRKEITSLLPQTRIFNVWGSSETGGAIFCDVSAVVADSNKIGSLGKALSEKVEVSFINENAPLENQGEVCGHLADWFVISDSSHPGRMAIRGDMQMIGYWQDEQRTKATLIDGWLVTGDLGYKDAQGNIYMMGRADDIINSGGEKVSPIEVEEAAGQYEHIQDCACIGVEDPEGILGHVPVLFVVTRSNYSETELTKWMADKLEKLKLPRQIITLEEIPRNQMKKIDRKALKKLWDNQDSLTLINPVVDAILSRHSIRRFTNQKVPKEQLDMIIKCGYHAPSSHNIQSWRFTVLNKEDDIVRLKEATKTTAERNNTAVYGFENPSAVILISNDRRNPCGCQDASCAAENMMIAAQSYGIGSVWLNSLLNLRGEEPVKQVLNEFGVPENHVIWCMLALGYQEGEAVVLKKNNKVVHYH